MTELVNMESVLKLYERHRANVKRYQSEHPDKCKQWNMKHYHKMKNDDPEKYREYLDKKNAYMKKKRTEKKQDDIAVDIPIAIAIAI
jgi:hypothetical protein